MSGNRHVATKLRLLLVCSALHLGARATASAGQVTHSWCEPPEAVRAELDAIDRWGSDCMPSEDCWPSHMDTAKRLLAAYPDDLFVNRTYQDLVEQGSVQHRESLLALRAEYKARAEARPRDPVAQYLAGRIADNAAEERKFYEKALTLAPDFAWAHRGLARVEAQKDEPATRDQQFIKHELERFMTLCPNRPEAVLQLATAVDDGAFWQTHRASLRAAVKAENPHDQFAAWHGLWTLEFRMTPVGQHPQLREQVARDIEGIERLHLRDDPSWWAVLAHGFELTGDTQGKKQLNADLLQTHPCSTLAVRSTEEAFRSDHAIPSDAAPKEEKAHYEKTFYDATGKWLARCPDNFEFWLNRLGAIKDRPELPNEVVRADLDRIVQLWERNRGLFGMAESPYVVVSRIFLERNLEVERVPSLVEKEIELHHEEQTNYERIPDEEERGLWRIYESTQLARLKALEGRAELALGRRDAARKDLDTAAAGIEALRKPPPTDSNLLKSLDRAEAEVWEQRAALAAADGHGPDAVAMLLRAAALAPDRKELGEKAAALWRQAGGTPAGWALLAETSATSKAPGVTVATAQTGWEKATTVLKPFDLQATDGSRWTLGRLNGKVAFINVWATWCGPCREELPEVQKLYERLKGRTDVVLLTLDVDSDVGLVAPFLTAQKYSFPALLAEAYMRDLWKGMVIVPTNWVVDRGGRVRFESKGFDPKARTRWADGVLALIDGLTQEKAGTPGPTPTKAAGHP